MLLCLKCCDVYWINIPEYFNLALLLPYCQQQRNTGNSNVRKKPTFWTEKCYANYYGASSKFLSSLGPVTRRHWSQSEQALELDVKQICNTSQASQIFLWDLLEEGYHPGYLWILMFLYYYLWSLISPRWSLDQINIPIPCGISYDFYVKSATKH